MLTIRNTTGNNAQVIANSIRDLPARVVPYVASTALTRTARIAAKTDLPDAMRSVFDNPTPVTLNSLFVKPSTTVIGPHQPIVLPSGVGRVDYEGELGLVIGRRTHRATPRQAGENILGLCCGNDVTARDLQRIDGQWTRAKGFDGFCPLGPWVATGVEPDDLMLETFVNGVVKQRARTSDMLFHPYELVSFISNVMTLVPGDVVLTGTPGGIGPLVEGDLVEVRIENVGSLSNPVSCVDAGATEAQ